MSQGSYNVPTGGSYSMVTFAGLMNAAYNALATQSSGASAPVNGPGNLPQEFQSWFNTTNVNFPVFNFFDGVNWDRFGTMDVAGSNWLPKMGGGAATLATTSTVNIGASPQTYISLTGTTTVTSFGTAATIGEERKIQSLGNFILQYGAGSIITPGLANINVLSGDSFTAIYQGSSIWQIFGYVRGLGTAGFTLPTGSVFWMPAKNVSIAGTVRGNGLTIGSASSSGTELASATAVGLFTYLWNNFSNSVLPVSGGRGASAAADFTANKTIQLPDLRGYVLAGLDDMGNSAALRLTSSTMTPDGISALATGGGQTQTLTAPQTPLHTHSLTDNGHLHNLPASTPNFAAGASWSSAAGATQAIFSATNTATIGIPNTDANGGPTPPQGQAHPNIQPTTVGTYYICL